VNEKQLLEKNSFSLWYDIFQMEEPSQLDAFFVFWIYIFTKFCVYDEEEGQIYFALFQGKILILLLFLGLLAASAVFFLK
jgi:hypothetical protein